MQFFDSKECEWADMEVYLDLAKITKIRGMRFKVASDKQHLFAAGNKPFSIQSGNKTYTGELKALKGALDDMNAAAIAAGGEDITDVSFTIVVTFAKKGVRKLSSFTMIGVEVSEFEYGWDQGAKEMEVTLPFLYLDLKP